LISPSLRLHINLVDSRLAGETALSTWGNTFLYLLSFSSGLSLEAIPKSKLRSPIYPLLLNCLAISVEFDVYIPGPLVVSNPLGEGLVK